VIYFKIKGTPAQGHDATILVDICDAILQAERKGTLHPKQKHLAQKEV
jgi:hypothetical protein